MMIDVNEPTIKTHKVDLTINIDELYRPQTHITTQMLVVKCSTFTDDVNIYDKINDYLNRLQSKVVDDITNLY